MNIDLTQFTRIDEIVVPIVNKLGIYQGRKIKLNVDNGWYLIRLGATATVQRLATRLEIYRTLTAQQFLLAYAVGSEAVPVNFDNFKRRGYDESIEINFMQAQPFDVVKVVKWEDKRWYFYEQDLRFQRQLIRGIKEAYTKRESLSSMRGVTPEIRYAFLLGDLQRESYDAAVEYERLWNLSPESRERLHRQFKLGIKFRLESAVAKAGGTFVGFNKLSNGGYQVEWTIGGQTVKSQIKDDFRVISAGYCLSGDDVRHTLGSLVNLAKVFQENRPLHITRE